MREIKFRIWDKIDEAFIEDSQNLKMIVSEYIDNKDFVNSIFGSESLIFQQFTGLKSKFAQDVYEGDIVKTTRLNLFDEIEEEATLRVGWSEIECGWRGFTYLESPDKKSSGSKITECEVIGNIFENKEMIE